MISRIVLGIILLGGIPQSIHAADTLLTPTPMEEVTTLDSGNTAWLLASSGLVLLMTPGLAFFYGGLVRRKNILSVLMQCFSAMCVVTLCWVTLGYTLAFGTDIHGLIGGFNHLFLKDVGSEPLPGHTIPHLLFMAFQMKFAIITPALIIGAGAERMKFSAFCIFSVLWSLLVYAPIAHWVWGGGFMSQWGALDFAGGTVVHINAGMASLATAIVLGKRVGAPSPPHSLPLAILGAGMLWFGWFGFNAGSSLAADKVAVNALVTTHIATASAGLTWVLCDKLFHKHTTTLGMISGAVAGLVAITPACGFVTPMSAMVIGFGASIVCFFMVTFVKTKLHYDDTLDAFGVHGVGGIWGAIATGIFASKAVNSTIIHTPATQSLIQLKATLITMVFSFIASYILLRVLDMIMGLRVSEVEELMGLDLAEHKEAGYTTLD